MKECKSCHIKLNTNYEFCPFCQDKLEGKSFSYYPKYKKRKSPKIFKIIVFISILIALITGFIDYQIHSYLTWSMYILLALLSNIIITYYIFNSENDIHNSLVGYGLVLILIAIIWYYLTKLKYITDYIIPILCILIMLYTSFISFFTKVKPLSFLSVNMLVVIEPILLVLGHYTTNNLLCYLCILIFIIIILRLYFFHHDELKEELIKIFRI